MMINRVQVIFFSEIILKNLTASNIRCQFSRIEKASSIVWKENEMVTGETVGFADGNPRKHRLTPIHGN